jgi:dUTPase
MAATARRPDRAVTGAVRRPGRNAWFAASASAGCLLMGDIQGMLDAQRSLIRTISDTDYGAQTGDERAESIRLNVLALTDELHEALRESGWKTWASSRHLNRYKFKEELIDAWHFFMNLWLIADGTEDEFLSMYFRKRQTNLNRYENGYTGTSDRRLTAFDNPTLCALCSTDIRALERGDISRARFADKDGNIFCSEDCAKTFPFRHSRQ